MIWQVRGILLKIQRHRRNHLAIKVYVIEQTIAPTLPKQALHAKTNFEHASSGPHARYRISGPGLVLKTIKNCFEILFECWMSF